MTQEEFLAQFGIVPGGDDSSIWRMAGEERGVTGAPVDPQELLGVYDRFSGANFDFNTLARQQGYTGNNPAEFLMGMQDKSGNPVAYGSWSLGREGGLDKELFPMIQDWAYQNGVDPVEYNKGAMQGGSTLGNLLTYAPLIGGAMVGAAGLGFGPLSGASTIGEGAAGFAGGASGGGLAGEAVGGALSGGAGATGAGGLGSGAFNVADFITQGILPGGGTISTPAIPGGSGLLGSATQWLTSQGGSALGNILGGNGGAQDWASILGSLGSAGLGIAGANAQGDAYSDVADKYLALGAPYREKLAGSYAPGFDLATADPAFSGALDAASQAAARATSARVGNPVDNPGAYAEMQKYILNSSVLPQLNTYRSQLGSFGQLGTNIAGTNDTQAAGQTAGMYNSAGFGLDQLTKQQNPYEQAMKGLLGQFGKLNQPGYL